MANFPGKRNQHLWRSMYNNSVWGARESAVRKCQLQLLATELSVHSAAAAGMHLMGGYIIIIITQQDNTGTSEMCLSKTRVASLECASTAHWGAGETAWQLHFSQLSRGTADPCRTSSDCSGMWHPELLGSSLSYSPYSLLKWFCQLSCCSG